MERCSLNDIYNKINAFYILSGIPISLYDRRKKEIVRYTDTSAEAFARHGCIARNAGEHSDDTIFTVCGLNYSRVAVGDYVIILGPVLSGSIDEEAAMRMAEACECLSANDRQASCDYFKRLAVVPENAFENFTNTLKFALGELATEKCHQEEERDIGDMADCLEYISENLCDCKLTLESVAYHCGYNPSYLSRKFKKSLGMNFNRYLMNVKLEKSADYLKNTCKSIAEIAADLYFSSQSHFQNAFKSVYGMTPNEYRRHAA